MRPIAYKPANLAEPAPLIAAIRARRGGKLMNLDRMLLHSAPLAEGWNGFLGRVRGELSVDVKLREIAICVVAVLNGADYEFHHHAPELLKAGGSQAQLEALKQLPAGEGSAWFDPAERATIRLAMEMTQAIQVSPATFDALKGARLNDQHIVELVGVVAAYNMVSRFLVALQVEPE